RDQQLFDLRVDVTRIGVCPVTFGDEREARKNFGFARACGREQRRRPTRAVADGQTRQRDVVVAARQRRRRGQYHVGVARGFVEVRVHADHERQPRKYTVEARAVGRREHWIAGDRDEHAHLTRPGRLDLVRQGGNRELRAHLRVALYAALPA